MGQSDLFCSLDEGYNAWFYQNDREKSVMLTKPNKTSGSVNAYTSR
jgi:hypothetical protein